MLVIGVAGQNGSGKDTIIDLMKERLDCEVVSETFSTVIRLTLEMWAIEPTRLNLQRLPVGMNEMFGQGALSRAVAHRLNSLSAPVVIVGGVRWPTDVDLVRSFAHNRLLYVETSAEIRFERLRRRGHKVAEKDMTFAQFLHEEDQASEAYLPTIKKLADAVIPNNDSLERLTQEIEAMCDQHIKALI